MGDQVEIWVKTDSKKVISELVHDNIYINVRTGTGLALQS